MSHVKGRKYEVTLDDGRVVSRQRAHAIANWDKLRAKSRDYQRLKRGWENITDILTETAIAELKKGNLLRFDFEGSPVELKIVANQDGQVWAKRITTKSLKEMEDSVRKNNRRRRRSRGL